MENSTIIASAYKHEYAHLNRVHQTRITRTDIARGIVSIGKTHWMQHLRTPSRSFFDFIHYWSGLQSYVIENPQLSLSPLFSQLDGSEKVSKSYQIGMGIAKIAAERILRVPYLQHVDALINVGAINLTSGTNERGDLVGMDISNNWHVVEAKGRSRNPTNELRRKAKLQAEKIATINGTAPKTKSYCISYLTQWGNQIELVDPDDLPAVPTGLEIKDDLFVKTYYDGIFGHLYRTSPDATLAFPDQDFRFSLFELPGADMYIGLLENYLKDLAAGNTDFKDVLFDRRGSLGEFARLNIDQLSIGIDGIVLMEKGYQNYLNTGSRLEYPQHLFGNIQLLEGNDVNNWLLYR